MQLKCNRCGEAHLSLQKGLSSPLERKLSMWNHDNISLILWQVQNFSMRNWECNRVGMNVKPVLRAINQGRLSENHFPVNVEVSIIRVT